MQAAVEMMSRHGFIVRSSEMVGFVADYISGHRWVKVLSSSPVKDFDTLAILLS